MKIYLHIGTHKTGTTAIQQFCCAAQTSLLSHNIYWPSQALDLHKNQHSGIANLIRSNQIDDAHAYLTAAVQAAHGHGAESLLLSGEGFCQLEDDEVSTLFHLLAGHEIIVIIYFRNLERYVIGVLNQRLRTPKRLPAIRGMLTNVRSKLNYSALIRRWEGAAGANNVVVRCYDAERTRLVASFLEIIGASTIDIDAIGTDGRANQSLDLATQLLLGASGINKSLKDFKRIRKDYETLFGEQPFFAPVTPMVARALCDGPDTDISHPKLAEYRALLSHPITMPKDSPDTQAYLKRVSILFGRAARRQRWRLRLARVRHFFSR